MMMIDTSANRNLVGLVYSDSAKSIVQRGLKQRPMSDDFGVKYMDGLIQRISGRFPRHAATYAKQENAFLHYMRNLMLFAEGKFFSRRTDITNMARKLANYE